MIQPQKIIIADDHPLFRQALLGTLRNKLSQTIWLEAETIAELEQQLQNNNESDLLLLDLNIPGAHGFSTLIHVRNHFPQIPVVVVSAHEDQNTIGKAMGYGAAGFIPKSTPVDDIFTAIMTVLSGDIWLPASFQATSANTDTTDIAERVASLTQQQYRILMMFAQGLLNKQIAYDLNVSEATIKAHATAIFRKLDVRNRTQAVIAISQLNLAETGFDQS
ncbi:response regulator transcription factor [Colwellia sp. 4_MG-2023]|jgi:DNA-binding NarL/FixJ family response regulator|uniref:response regulator transcription factor n=1 Tax=unclassified Colwellia TaxID=196834 RepID=UPI001C0936A6|nr:MULTISPECIES: response regulator transcription factor [unclassified Colwellia]MBU2923682.1 response regulator transcription factor [Colwellia sp. C2M11]MDO6486249.1 response regulator transcription factor [Colwellia sp. 6_MG-2023]MDO6505795.1 response regulator transcription factor [Colwellia sp. 5_MG-2023]MDO6554476.1 response regulator transcription factor [Colwellia sp. 4_MG-2023]MDO6652218.1 response regulator transcription factor [Colwellia sp. 3_MG-2023]